MKKKWHEYLWIASLVYMILGFFNILFAWLGLLCFFIPMLVAAVKGSKSYCGKYCGRGQLFSILGGRLGLSRKKDMPRWMTGKAFRYGFLAFFFAMFFLMLWNTYLVFAGVQTLKQAAKKVEDGIEETLTYYDFPSEHWIRIRTNNVIERLNREIRRRTRVVGTFPDSNSALMLVCARLRHVAGTQWGNKKYMHMKHLEPAFSDPSIA
jgi:hypothetical protein